MGKNVDVNDHFDINGELFDFDNVNVTTTLNGQYTNNIQTDLLDKVKAVIQTSLNGEYTNRVTTDVLDKISATMGISVKELAPLLFTLLWTEIPIVKFRVPHDYTFGFRFFGIEFFSVRFRGESKAVTAKNPAGAAGGIDV